MRKLALSLDARGVFMACEEVYRVLTDHFDFAGSSFGDEGPVVVFRVYLAAMVS